MFPSTMACKSGIPATTNPFGTISKRAAVSPHPWLGTDTIGNYGIPFKPGCYQACIHQIFSMIMVLLLLELFLKMFQHGQEFAKCALGLDEVVVLMVHSLVAATPALASQNSALPCCALSHLRRHTGSDGQGHSKCN